MSAPQNATIAKFEPTTEGMACAYLSIVAMAVVPILFGSFRSVKHQVATNKKCRETGEQAETMTDHDAAVFPFIASGALLGFYILMKFAPDLVNLVLSGYFFVLGTLAFSRLIKPISFKIFPSKFNSTQYTLQFGARQVDQQQLEAASNSSESSSTASSVLSHYDEMYIDWRFVNSDILSFLIGLALGVWYVLTKHWVANNAFGLAFALNGIELLNLNSVKIGCILLCGLFIYDIFWVFGTDVMVSVAKSFDAPIKLVFPQDFLINGFWGKHFAMLGLGDIVIPGIYIALLLRFDHSTKRSVNLYFWSCFTAYVLGLGITIFVMSYYHHAQPALLYLVPCCIIVPFIVALIKGDVKALLKYRDHPEEEKNDDENTAEVSKDELDSTKKPTKRTTRSTAKKVN